MALRHCEYAVKNPGIWCTYSTGLAEGPIVAAGLDIRRIFLLLAYTHFLASGLDIAKRVFFATLRND